MKEMLKDKRVLIAGIAVLVLIFLGAGFFLISSRQSNSNAVNTNVLPTQVPVLSLSPDDIGLSLTLSANGQKATMVITKTTDISSVDYQLLYNAVVSGQQVPRGTIGHVDIKTPGKTVSQDMIFGTCSDVCHYDTGISGIQLIVKVTKTDGKVYQVQLNPTPTPSQ